MKKVLYCFICFIVLTGCNNNKKFDDEIKKNCSDYEIIDSINFGGGEGDITGTVKYGICNKKEEFYAVSKGVFNTKYSYEIVNVYKYKNSLYSIDNDIITIIASDDISNYKDLIYNGKTLNYSRIKFYNLKNITDSQTKLLLYKYVNIDNALNKDKYSEVQFISYTSLFKNAFENSNLDIDKYIYDSTKVNK